MTDTEKPPNSPRPAKGNEGEQYANEGWHKTQQEERKQNQQRAVEIIEEQNKMREKAKNKP